MGCEAARNILDKKKIPIIYDDAINTIMVSMEEDANLLSSYDNRDKRLMGLPRA